MGFVEDFKKIVKEAATTKFSGDTDLAKKACVAQSAVSMLNNNKRSGLQLGTIGKLLDAIGAKIVLPSEPATVQRMGVHSPKIVVGEEDRLIDVYHVAGAGQAWEIVEVEPIKSIRAPISFVAQISFALLVQGDSMYPTLKSGSVVGVRRDDPFVNSEIYAVTPPEGGLSVKRVIRDYQREGYILRSDNPDKGRYEDVFIPNTLAKHLLVGRVVWVWQGV